MTETKKQIKNAEDVRKFAAILNSELDQCDNGEGMECASLDASLEHYAARCCLISEQIKSWGRDVFTGRIAYEKSVDEAWYRVGVEINNRAAEMLERAQVLEVPCYDLPGANKLCSSLLALYQLLDGWVSPQRSVGPSARQAHQSSTQIETVKEQIAALRPLPKGWAPSDIRQLGVFRKASNT